MDRLQIRKKNISRKGTSIVNIGWFEFWKKKQSEHSINQGFDGLETFQAKNNAAITLDFQLVDYLHMKSGKIDVVGRPLIERRSRKRSSPETVVRFGFCMYHESQWMQRNWKEWYI